MTSRESSRGRNGHVEALDFDVARKTSNSPQRHHGSILEDNESLLSNVVEGIIQKDRRKMRAQIARYLSYASAILSCVCAGSISIFSLYGHLFLTRLHYNQYEINAISIGSGLALYLPVPVFGYLVDRFSSRPVSFIAGLLFIIGYGIAAFAYHSGPSADGGWPSWVMIMAFVFIGAGTSSMYLAATSVCVKNFGRGNHKGLALSLPIAAFGLSGMWESQVGSRLLYERNPDGTKGDIDVFRFFLFLAGLLLGVGLVGAALQRVVDEEVIIENAVEDLERSGFLEDSAFFSHQEDVGASRDYGTISEDAGEMDSEHPLLRPTPHQHKSYEDGSRFKTVILNSETRRFLSDPIMWLLTLGFFLLSGPVETYINNLGTVVGTLYQPPQTVPEGNSAATNVSLLAVGTTIGRLFFGAVSDIVAPPLSGKSSQYRRPGDPEDVAESYGKRFSLSRVTLLLSSSIFVLVAYGLLLSPLAFSRPDSTFPAITLLVGLANGASFSLIPIIISIVWGVTNFATNWGIVAMMPALGSTIWSLAYSAEYQKHTRPADGLCYGRECWQGAVSGMFIAGLLSALSWSWCRWGRRGLNERGVVI